ncbi:TonB-dependent siderophore receptor [Acinetobacter sp. SWAC57]|uniref:TonB-dependent siderophore receptor n=1 Tax=Acinetobacter sp. SWAC57 TaxID=2293834 RepID=UPI0013C366F6|nr:TonB-dependent siderophore receptor [Acinetobacter sp. SWAC57]
MIMFRMINGVVIGSLVTTQIYAQNQSENEVAVLSTISLTATSNDSSEQTQSYTVEKSKSASRLSLSLKETPQSVNVITHQRIKDQQLNSAQEVLENTTGISTYTYDTTRNSFYSRGFQIDSFQYDGIPTSYVNGASYLDTAFYDRFEIVRGATGLTSGSGNPAASVNLIRKKPQKEFSTNLNLSAGSWDNYRAVADVSLPITSDGTIRSRIVGTYTDKKSFLDHLEDQRKGIYATVESDLSDQTTLSLGIEYQDITPNGVLWGGLPLFYSDGSKTNFDRSKSSAAKWSHWDYAFTNTFLTLDHKFENDWSMKLNYTHGDERANYELFSPFGSLDRTTDATSGSNAIAGFAHNTNDNIDISTTGLFQLFGREHELVVGGTWSQRKERSRGTGWLSSKISMSNIENFTNYNGDYIRPDFNAAKFDSLSSADIKQSSLYATGRFQITDDLKLIAGGRVNNYQQEGVSGITPINFSKNGKFTPYLGLTYNINDTYTTYISYSEIFKPQNYYDKNGNLLKPTQGSTQEVGIKASYFDDKLNLAVSAYKNSLDHVAERDGSNYTPTGASAYNSVDGTESKGIDIDIQGEIRPNWNIYTGISSFAAENQNGGRLNSYLPRTTARLFTSYRLPGQYDAITVGGGINWQSRIYTTATNPVYGSVEVGQKSYALVSIMGRYDINPNTNVALNIKNIFDEKYYQMIGFYNQYNYGEPRSAILSFNYKF